MAEREDLPPSGKEQATLTLIRDAACRTDDARASGEFRAVLVEELGHRARGAAGDLLEGAGRVVVLAGQDRPLACDEQLSRPGRYPGAGEALEELPLGRDRPVLPLMDRDAQRWRTMSRCQRKTVSGINIRSPLRRAFGITLSRAASPGPPSSASVGAPDDAAGRRAGGAGSRSLRSSAPPRAGTDAARRRTVLSGGRRAAGT